MNRFNSLHNPFMVLSPLYTSDKKNVEYQCTQRLIQVERFYAGCQPQHPCECLYVAGTLSPRPGLAVSPWHGRNTLTSVIMFQNFLPA